MNNDFKTGTPLDLISLDNDSNVFMKMTTESGNGFMVGGGPFENGLMGTLALTDADNKYPTMNIFSGNLDNYTITWNALANSYTIADTRTGTPDGTDTLTGVENFQFAEPGSRRLGRDPCGHVDLGRAGC